LANEICDIPQKKGAEQDAEQGSETVPPPNKAPPKAKPPPKEKAPPKAKPPPKEKAAPKAKTVPKRKAATAEARREKLGLAM
jgi:hypothetical protein